MGKTLQSGFRLAAMAAALAAAALGAATPGDAGGPATAGGSADRHVALISIDGLRPAEYLGGGPCGPPPRHLAALMRSGAWARGVEGALPSLTYPAHATLVTGVRPVRHGVLANARWRDGAEWHFDRSDIHATTLWDEARKAGRTVAIVTWPSTYGAEADALVPEDLSLDREAKDRIRAGSTPGLLEALEAATGPVTLLPFRDPEACLPLDRMTTAFACALVRTRRPALLLMHLLDLDHREHDDGPGSEAACHALARIDERLGEVRDAYEAAGLLDRATFIVVSDHGFLPVTTMVNLPALLAEAGFGRRDPATGRIEIDLAAHGTQGSAALYAREAATRGDRKRIEQDLRGALERRYQRCSAGLQATRHDGWEVFRRRRRCCAPGPAISSPRIRATRGC